MTNKTKVKKEILHFKVHPNIINIIRQGYWFEDRKDWAMDCLRSLGDNMTLKIADDLLKGKNGLTTSDGGVTLELTNKPDVEFQKELKKHNLFVDEKKKEKEKYDRLPICNNDTKYAIDCKHRCTHDLKCEYVGRIEDGTCYLDKLQGKKDTIVQTLNVIKGDDQKVYVVDGKIAEKKGKKCTVEDCKFYSSNVCTFGQRDRWGCYQAEEDVRDKMTEFNLQASSIGRQGMEGVMFVKSEGEKTFDFKYKGYHFKIKDSARNQGNCPHCQEPASDHFWDVKKDKEAYIGHKYFGMKINILGKQEKAYAVCFKCPKCKRHFYYHNTYKRI